MTWLLLIHQVPPAPPYLRAKVLRRLKQVGALPLKNSAYLLPNAEDTLEDFQWILKEIKAEKGEAWILKAEAVAGLTDDEIRHSFRELRRADYQELLAELRAEPENSRKLRNRYDDIVKIDFFDAEGRKEVETAMNQTEPSRWVTRRGIKVDRCACDWLIRRFIDASAEIAFVDPDRYQPRAGDLRFDMFEGEFTHEGDQCSFEVIARRRGISNPRVNVIAEIIHDLDLKDGKFARPETAGIGAILDGIFARHPADEDRIAQTSAIFDALVTQASRPAL